MNVMKATQQDTPDKGKLKVNLTSEITAYPVADATISIYGSAGQSVREADHRLLRADGDH